MISSDDEDEPTDGVAKEDTAAGRLKAARALSRRRMGLAQDMQLMASSLVQRLIQTIQQQSEPSTQQPASASVEVADSGKIADESTETGPLGFSSSSASSLSASLPTIALCLSLLHALAITARKARKASGIDQSTSSFSALLSSAGCLEVSLTPSQAALLCATAPQLSASSRADIFQSITLSALSLPLASAAGMASEQQTAVMSVVRWTHQFVSEAGSAGESSPLVAQWLRWMTALLSGEPQLRDWLLASDQLLVQALLSLYPLLMRPTSAPTSSSDSGLAQLNRSLLHVDSLIPATQQIAYRLQSSSHYSTLRSAYGQLRSEYDTQTGEEAGSDRAAAAAAWGAQVKAAVLLHDAWLAVLAGDEEAQSDVTLHSITLQQREKGKHNGNGVSRKSDAASKRK